MTIANMFLRQLAVATLALLGGVHAANCEWTPSGRESQTLTPTAVACCFVVQDEAHEVYWSEYATEIHTTAYNLTSIVCYFHLRPRSFIRTIAYYAIRSTCSRLLADTDRKSVV